MIHIPIIIGVIVGKAIHHAVKSGAAHHATRMTHQAWMNNHHIAKHTGKFIGDRAAKNGILFKK
ncbi:MAG: hypothetical protein WCO51_11825 [bacterium]